MANNNSQKIILDLCGGTGSWSRPYKDAGYDVRNITLPDYDVKIYKPPDNVYGILAAPPCTEFSYLTILAQHKYGREIDFKKGMEIVTACLTIIWECNFKRLLKFWSLENPRGRLRFFLGNPILTFNPFDYGDFYSKPTDLWGRFVLPKKNPFEGLLTKNYIHDIDKYNRVHGLSKQAKRAITSPCFARAFFEANP